MSTASSRLNNKTHASTLTPCTSTIVRYVSGQQKLDVEPYCDEQLSVVREKNTIPRKLKNQKEINQSALFALFLARVSINFSCHLFCDFPPPPPATPLDSINYRHLLVISIGIIRIFAAHFRIGNRLIFPTRQHVPFNRNENV